jgi:hypothetical protein
MNHDSNNLAAEYVLTLALSAVIPKNQGMALGIHQQLGTEHASK